MLTVSREAAIEVQVFLLTLEVHEFAGLAFSTLYKSIRMQAIDEIVPTLLHALENDQMSDTALDGLKQILSVRTTTVLMHILPELVQLPLSYVFIIFIYISKPLFIFW